jgi:hypothetical protein
LIQGQIPGAVAKHQQHLYDGIMLELLLLWKLSDVREELRDYESEDLLGVAAVAMMAQIFLWPLTLGALVGKKFGWVVGSLVAIAAAVLALIFNWGIFIVIGFAAIFISGFFIVWCLTFTR